MSISPFPIDWVRNVDLITPLSLQQVLNKNQEVFYLRGRASEQISRIEVIGKEPIKLEGGLIKIYPYDTTTRSFPVEFGSRSDFENRMTLREIWETIVNEVAIPDVVIQERACVISPPRRVPDIIEEVIQGIDEFYQIEQSRGWRRKIAGIPCMSVQKTMKNELISNGILKSTKHPGLRRLRGVLLTAFILPAIKVGKVVDIKGWQSVFRDNEVAHAFQRVIRAKKFWHDTAIPWKFIAEGDSIVGYIYRLESRNKLLGVEAPSI